MWQGFVRIECLESGRLWLGESHHCGRQRRAKVKRSVIQRLTGGREPDNEGRASHRPGNERASKRGRTHSRGLRGEVQHQRQSGQRQNEFPTVKDERHWVLTTELLPCVNCKPLGSTCLRSSLCAHSCGPVLGWQVLLCLSYLSLLHDTLSLSNSQAISLHLDLNHTAA